MYNNSVYNSLLEKCRKKRQTDTKHKQQEEQTDSRRDAVIGLRRIFSFCFAAVRCLCDEPMSWKGYWPLTSAERSVETLTVTRPPSLVVVRSSTSQRGSPVRVLVADSPPAQSPDDGQLARHAPLCTPETSDTPSGRASPANTSVSTYQEGIVVMNVSYCS